MRYTIILLVMAFASCHDSGSHEDHAHYTEDNHITPEQEIPTVSYTIWTENTELFVDFPVLIVGESSRFAAHFTVLDGHQPVRSGSVTVSLGEGASAMKATESSPSSEGIFLPTIQPKSAGVYPLIFYITSPNLSDTIEIKEVQVFGSMEEAQSALDGPEDNNSISFSKEQAWKIEFQTTRVVSEKIYSTIPTSGVWRNAASDNKTMVATANGVVSFSNRTLTDGTKVKKGQKLLSIVSNELTDHNIDKEISIAQANYEQAKAEYDRKKQLYESKIVSKAEFEIVEERYKIATTNYQTLTSAYVDGGKQILAPFDGFIKSLKIENGGYAEQGMPLLTVSTEMSRLLETHVSSAYGPQLDNLQDIWYQPSEGIWSSLKSTNGKVISVGKSVNPGQPLLSIFAEVNELVLMPEGGYTEVELALGLAENTTVIPLEALLEDYGSYSVIVQLSGESFERRPVTIGSKNGGKVEIASGLNVGEVVVSTGAYQVKMAAMSGELPAHGHAH